MIVSILNDEKVVKPPKNPTANSSLIDSLLKVILFISSAVTIPIKKLPTIFTVNVPNGKLILVKFLAMIEIIYLNIEPIPPPMNTIM